MSKRVRKASKDANIIATRTLTDEATHRTVIVTLWAPIEVHSDEWSCAYRIPGMRKTRQAFGIDAIQSLSNALEAVRMSLKDAKSNYTWKGGEQGDPGFEQPIPHYFGVKFADRMARLIDREARTLARTARTERSRRS